MKIYIASGWFTKEQEDARQDILVSLELTELDYYSPKEDGLFEPGKIDPQKVFEENIKQIQHCDAVVVSTMGKDMGTLFECGVAYMIGRPLIYYWKGGTGKFNLMLSQTAKAVFTEPKLLLHYLRVAQVNGYFTYIPYKGEIE